MFEIHSRININQYSEYSGASPAAQTWLVEPLRNIPVVDETRNIHGMIAEPEAAIRVCADTL